MKKLICVILSTLLTFCLIIAGCGNNKCTITLVQDGQKDIVLSVEKGSKPTLPEPVQFSNNSIITEWNVPDNFVAEENKTIQAISYTSGIVFNFRNYHLETAVVVQSYNGESPVVVIPEYYRGYPIKVLARSAFKNQSHVVKITLPEGLEEVQYYPFQGLSNLTGVNIPSTLKRLESYAFCDAKNSGTSIVPSGVTSVPDHAFLGFRGERAVFEEGIENIYKFVFAGKNSLKEIVLPSTIKEISFLAFCWQPVEKIFYAGREGDFNNVRFIDDRDDGERIDENVKKIDERINDGDTIVYYYSESEPIFSGYYWHYVNGEVTIWE